METKQKIIIRKILQSTTSHPSPEWVFEKVREEMPGVSLSTVYRNLRLMKEAGEIMELKTADRKSRYDGNIKRHSHFVCDHCGKIFDLLEPINLSEASRIADATGFHITRLTLEAEGLCSECHKKLAAKKSEDN
jgi:Fe2+ or Zn2+ uptake regulation protein